MKSYSSIIREHEKRSQLEMSKNPEIYHNTEAHFRLIIFDS
jgi:hypothetical protein